FVCILLQLSTTFYCFFFVLFSLRSVCPLGIYIVFSLHLLFHIFFSSLNKMTTELDINMTGEIDTDMVRIAERLLNKPEQLEERCREQLEELEGPQRWELCKEAVKLTLRQSE